MIGFFDSGFGWLHTMQKFQKLYPQYDYIFLADNANCPFGNKTGEKIQELTFQWIERLFEHWAKIVILACNTAAAYSVRKRQSQYPEKKVLSITIPGIEKIISDENSKKVWILATQATILSNIYTDLFFRFGGKDSPDFQFVMAPKLVDLIESWEEDEKTIYDAVWEYMSKFQNIDSLILGCTHFPILLNYIQEFFQWTIIDPSQEAAIQFGNYLQRHPEIEEKLNKNQITQYFTTWSTQLFENIWAKIISEKISVNKISTKE